MTNQEKAAYFGGSSTAYLLAMLVMYLNEHLHVGVDIYLALCILSVLDIFTCFVYDSLGETNDSSQL